MTELQQKILFYLRSGYEAKQIAGKLDITAALVKWNLHHLRLHFKAKNSTELVAKLYCNGIMQQIEKEYL